MANYILQATLSNLLVATVIAVLAWFIHRRMNSASLANLLWAIVLLKLVTPPILSLPVFEIPSLAEQANPATAFYSEPDLDLPPGHSTASSATPHAIEMRQATKLPTERKLSHRSFVLAVCVFWALSSLFFLTISLWRILRFHRLLCANSELDQQLTDGVATDLARQLRLHRPEIWTTQAKVAPFVWWLRGLPAVVIPRASLEKLDGAEIRLILGHELAHIKRRDHWFRWVEWIAQILFWWNPLVWLARKHLRESEEIACDELVLTSCKSAADEYANSLLNMAEILASPSIQPPIVASPLYGGGCLEKRLKTMLSKKPWPVPLALRWSILITAICIFPLGFVYAQDIGAVERRLGAAVEAGELSLEQAKLMLDALRTSKKTDATVNNVRNERRLTLRDDVSKSKSRPEAATNIKAAQDVEQKLRFNIVRQRDLEVAKAANQLVEQQLDLEKAELWRAMKEEAKQQQQLDAEIEAKRAADIKRKIEAAVRSERISKEEAVQKLQELKAEKAKAEKQRSPRRDSALRVENIERRIEGFSFPVEERVLDPAVIEVQLIDEEKPAAAKSKTGDSRVTELRRLTIEADREAAATEALARRDAKKSEEKSVEEARTRRRYLGLLDRAKAPAKNEAVVKESFDRERLATLREVERGLRPKVAIVESRDRVLSIAELERKLEAAIASGAYKKEDVRKLLSELLHEQEAKERR